MKTNMQPVAEATQDTTRELMLYDAFNLTKEQSRKVIDACIPHMNKWADGSTANCDVAKDCMDAVETIDEKLYAIHLFGIFYGVNQNSDVDAREYFKYM